MGMTPLSEESIRTESIEQVRFNAPREKVWAGTLITTTLHVFSTLQTRYTYALRPSAQIWLATSGAASSAVCSSRPTIQLGGNKVELLDQMREWIG